MPTRSYDRYLPTAETPPRRRGEHRLHRGVAERSAQLSLSVIVMLVGPARATQEHYVEAVELTASPAKRPGVPAAANWLTTYRR